MAQQIDSALLSKLASKLGKPIKYVREQLSKKAASARVRSSAYLIYWANQKGIGTARYLSSLDPYLQEQARSLGAVSAVHQVKQVNSTSKIKHPPVRRKAKHINYVDPDRLVELSAIKSDQFNLKRLIQMCKELNHCFKRRDFIATIALVRAIADHTPPIFRFDSFSKVWNNASIAKSTRDSFRNLDTHSRNIADAYLHIQARKSETLPTSTQVDFSQSLDVLLGEVVRVLS